MTIHLSRNLASKSGWVQANAPETRHLGTESVRKVVKPLRTHVTESADQTPKENYAQNKWSGDSGFGAELMAVTPEHGDTKLSKPESSHLDILDSSHGDEYNTQISILELGEQIRRTRVSKHLTLEEVAQAAETTVSQLSLIERGLGKRGPTLDLLLRICRALNLKVGLSPTA